MLNRLLKLSISAAYYSAYRCLRLFFRLFKKQYPGTFVVLTYHSVKPEQRSKFEKHMDELVKVGSAVSAGVEYPLRNGQHYVAVTFDDGFQSVLDNALPVLVERKIPATIFVTTGHIGEKPGWICNPLHNNVNEVLLQEDQIKGLPDDLVTVGSHCVTHPKLAELGQEAAMRELVDSKRTLEEISNKPITMFSFPYGSYDEKIIELSKLAGYKRVFLNIPASSISRFDGYLIGRIPVSMDDWLFEYRLKCLGAYRWLPIAIFLKKNLISLYGKIFK
jgi:peptidoglycan/xylan/chitin deacetylase (PgdA/CDA1 family)